MERRVHSDRVKELPKHLPHDMDLMLEAKDKEQAVFEMYKRLDQYPVDPSVHHVVVEKQEASVVQEEVELEGKRKRARR